MTPSKKLFGFLYGLIALMLTICVASTAYQSFSHRQTPEYNPETAAKIDRMAQAFLTYKAHKLDPDSKMLDLTDSQWDRIRNESIFRDLELSPNFRWKVSIKNKSDQSDQNPESQMALSSHEDPNTPPYSLHTRMEFTNGGDMVSKESTYKDIPEGVATLKQMDEYFADGGLLTAEQEAEGVQYPEGLVMEYSIPQQLSPPTSQSSFYNLLTQRDRYVTYINIACGLALIMMMLLIFAWPIDVEREMPLFAPISAASFEGALFVMILGLPFAGFCYSMALNQLSSVFDFTTESRAVYLNQCIFMGLASSLMICTFTGFIFWLKDIYKVGAVRYFREKSLLYKRGLSYAKKMWLDTFFYKKTGWFNIFFLTIILGGAAFLLKSWVFMAVVLILFIGWQTWSNINLSRSLQTLYSEVQKLSKGDFEITASDESEITTPIYNDLMEIRTSWKKTLEQERASRESKNELIGNVSHDLKTPLTGLQNYSELLQRARTDEERQKYAKKIYEYTGRLSALVEDLFDISKANDNALELELMDLRLDDLIEAAVDEHYQALDKKGIEVVVSFHERPMMVRLDPYRTMRIFDNLIGNIAKYNLPGARAFIDTEDLGDQVKITVKNTSAKPLNFTEEEIVERFVRGDRSRHEVGSGLGLAIVKSFTEIQGGSFRIQTDGDLFKAILVFNKLKADEPKEADEIQNRTQEEEVFGFDE